MAGKISNFLREYKLIFSILLTIIGIFVFFFIGLASIWIPEIPSDLLKVPDGILEWNIYLIIAGFIIFGAGVWYLFVYLKDKKFILDELTTNKRSELIKKHGELKSKARHMPSKYQKMLKEKEDELKI